MVIFWAGEKKILLYFYLLRKVKCQLYRKKNYGREMFTVTFGGHDRYIKIICLFFI